MCLDSDVAAEANQYLRVRTTGRAGLRSQGIDEIGAALAV